MSRRWMLPLLLAVPLAVGFVGCGKKKTADGDKTTEKTGPGPGHGLIPGPAGTSTVSTKVDLPTATKPIDTQYITEDFIAAVVLHPARALDSKLGKGLLAEVEKEVGKKKVADVFAKMKMEAGVDPRKVEQVIVLIDGGAVFQTIPFLMGGGAERAEPPRAVPSTSPPSKPERKPCEEGDDDCLPQPKGFPEGKEGHGPPRSGRPMPPIPSVIVRFSEPVDQKAILSRIAAKLDSRKATRKVPNTKGPVFPAGKGDEKKPSPPAKSDPPRKTESSKKADVPKDPAPKGDESSECADDEKEAEPKLPSKTHEGKKYHLVGPLAVCFVDDKTLLAGKESLLKKMITAKDVKSPLTERLRTLGDEHDLVLALNVQSLTPLLANVPRDELPPDAQQALDYAGKVKTLAITGSISGGTLVSVVAQMPSEADAKGFAALIRDKGVTQALEQYRKMKADPRKKPPKEAEWVVTLVDQMVAGLAVGTQGTDVIVSVARPAELDNLPSRIGPAIKTLTRGMKDSVRKNDLKQIGLALHNHHDTHKALPAADSNGYPAGPGRKAGLSWRVHLLPFLDQKALYDQFKLDEAWDSPHNKALISRMPALFANPAVGLEAKAGKTSLHVFVGNNNTPFSIQAGGVSVGARFAMITDGTSNTIAVVEAGPENADIWTKPGGLPFDATKNPYDVLGKIPDQGFLALFLDGAVYTIQKSRSPDDLKLLIQHNDGKFASPWAPAPGRGERGASDSRKR